MKPLGISDTAGFSLVEIVIAMGIAAFCLVAMLGLLPTGLKAVNTSVEQTTATESLASIAADLRDIQPGSNSTPSFGIPIPTSVGVAGTPFNFTLSETGAKLDSNDFSAHFAVITTLSNSTAFLTTATIQIYWPPTAQLKNAQGMVETVISFNRN